MTDNRPLSALSYLSVFFAPFIVPIIVFFLSKDAEVRGHSKKAFISHLIPFLSVIVALFLFLGAAVTESEALLGGAFLASFVAIVVVNLVVVIYNIYKAIKLYV